MNEWNEMKPQPFSFLHSTNMVIVEPTYNWKCVPFTLCLIVCVCVCWIISHFSVSWTMSDYVYTHICWAKHPDAWTHSCTLVYSVCFTVNTTTNVQCTQIMANRYVLRRCNSAILAAWKLCYDTFKWPLKRTMSIPVRTVLFWRTILVDVCNH